MYIISKFKADPKLNPSAMPSTGSKITSQSAKNEKEKVVKL
jgi:hypothetical protein